MIMQINKIQCKCTQVKAKRERKTKTYDEMIMCGSLM